MVDIIIPCYNAADTLPRALASILSQTKTNQCMVTVVDDCSTEDIKSICDNFSPYLKIQYIRNEKNMKYPGLVRQVGIKHTSAPYIMFLDADDMLAPGAVHIANNEMTKSGADVLIGSFFSEGADGKWTRMGSNDTTWLHGNIYKRKFLEDYGIEFCSRYNEDGSFNTMCYMLSDKVGYLDEPLYYWMFNKKSITRTTNNFSATHADDVISTLVFAYNTIFKNNYNEKKIFRNMGEHLSFFHKLISDIKLLPETENKQDKEDRFWSAIEDFRIQLGLDNFTEAQIQYVKFGFADGFVKFPKAPGSIKAQEFFNVLFPNTKLEIEDFNIAARQVKK